MAVTTNCKQFFFKSTVLQHLQRKYKPLKIKHLFSKDQEKHNKQLSILYRIWNDAQKKWNVQTLKIKWNQLIHILKKSSPQQKGSDSALNEV